MKADRMDGLKEKYDHLTDILKSYGSVTIAFSGGVDSTFLLAAARDALGDAAAAVTVHSRSVSRREREEAREFCESRGIPQIRVEVDELTIPGFAENPPDRCYICKKQLFTSMGEAARAAGFSVLAEGSNLDDMGDYRPGLRALTELGIKSPLREAGLTKADIRALSKQMDLPTWAKPSFACLSTRIPYGDTITAEKLDMIGEAEALLFSLGFAQVRVRLHGKMARIEVLPEDIERLAQKETREQVVRGLKEAGFTYVSLDLQGFRSGSLNETL